MHKLINSPSPRVRSSASLNPAGRTKPFFFFFLPSVALSFLSLFFLLFPFFRDQSAGESHEEESTQCGPGSTYYRAISSYNGHKMLRKIVGETIRERFANYVASTVSEPCGLNCVTNALSVYISTMTLHFSVLIPPFHHLRTLFSYIVSAPGICTRRVYWPSSPPARSFTNEKYR